MADSIKVAIEGIKEVQEAFQHFSVNMDAVTKQAAWNVSGHILYLAKKNCAEKFTGTPSFDPAPGTPTGRLMGSLTMASNWGKQKDAEGKGADVPTIHAPTATDAHAVNTGTNIEYAAFPEFGTRKMHARSYLYPAFFKCSNDLVPTIKKICEKRRTFEYFKTINEAFDAGGITD